ncbi:MAG: serine/threonine protein kinase [Verrucomicrobiales bacterium]|nr:serine/threonine protein kinase [Verrucomicrobiales bacterium]
MSATHVSGEGGSERDIFLGALAFEDPVERGRYLEAACGADGEKRRRVVELLETGERLGDFLESAALGESPVLKRARATGEGGEGRPGAGDWIGRYRLREEIGEGGCGVVYLAEQWEPVRREVALKIIKLGMDTRSVIARFEAERQALAMMDHHNIARVLDAGATETGRPYFAMELVRGARVTDYCDEHLFSIERRLELFVQVCHAIQHAHQKGVIHRDLKPSNVLVAVEDGRPVPKVIDFGIAKATERRLTEKTLHTEYHSFLGTPAYMSPEQAEMGVVDVDTRTDVYSLGVLLYELLTGSTPLDTVALLESGVDGCRRMIRELEPERPSARVATVIRGGDAAPGRARARALEVPRWAGRLRGDLDWIVMKCLEKDRSRRYETVNALAQDIQRYLEFEPVLARPPSAFYRLEKTLRRNRLVVVAGALVTLALFGGAAVSVHQAVRARQAEAKEVRLRRDAEDALLQAEQSAGIAVRNEYVADMNLAQQSLASGNFGRALQLLEKHVPRPGARDQRGFEWRYLWQQCRGNEHLPLPNQGEAITALAVSPDGVWVAVGQRDRVRIWDWRARVEAARMTRGAQSIGFVDDGRFMVTASRFSLRVWRTSDWTESREFTGEGAPMAVMHEGTRVASTTREGVRIRETAEWGEVAFLSGATGPVAFAPDGRRVATDSRDGIVIWPLDGGGERVVLEDTVGLISRGGVRFRPDRQIVFSPDGASVLVPRNRASARGVFVVSVWDAATGKERATVPADARNPEHTGEIVAMLFTRDGRSLVTASGDHSVRLWDYAAQRQSGAFRGHLNEVWAIAESPDGRWILSGAKDGGLNVWPNRPSEEGELLGEPGWVPLQFSEDGDQLAVLTPRGSVAWVEPRSGRIDREIALDRDRVPLGPFGLLGTVAVSADFRVMAQGGRDGRVRVWDMSSGASRLLKIAEGPAEYLALSRDGKLLYTGGWSAPWRAWSLDQPDRALFGMEPGRLLQSADGRTAASIVRDYTIQIWDVESRRVRQFIAVHSSLGPASALSADGRILATTSNPEDADNLVQLWDTETGKSLGACIGHKQGLVGVAFAPDGRTLATSSEDGTVKLWNVATQQELMSERRLGRSLRLLLFSPDGRWLAGSTGPWMSGAGIRVFQAPSWSEILAAEVGAEEDLSPEPVRSRD